MSNYEQSQVQLTAMRRACTPRVHAARCRASAANPHWTLPCLKAPRVLGSPGPASGPRQAEAQPPFAFEPTTSSEFNPWICRFDPCLRRGRDLGR